MVTSPRLDKPYSRVGCAAPGSCPRTTAPPSLNRTCGLWSPTSTNPASGSTPVVTSRRAGSVLGRWLGVTQARFAEVVDLLKEVIDLLAPARTAKLGLGAHSSLFYSSSIMALPWDRRRPAPAGSCARFRLACLSRPVCGRRGGQGSCRAAIIPPPSSIVAFPRGAQASGRSPHAIPSPRVARTVYPDEVGATLGQRCLSVPPLR